MFKKKRPDRVESLSAPPRHVAIIMDGNGRWARARGLPRVAGHRKGAEAVREALEAAREVGVSVLTLFSFSCENWQRPADEVEALMGLLRRYLSTELPSLHQKNVCFRIVGDREGLPEDILKLIEDAEAKTSNNNGQTLVLALNYGGRQDIVQAARHLAVQVEKGALSADSIDEALFTKTLWTEDLPDPDLLIRTSGEQRLSNFLLWQLAYSEFVFVDKYWPDFTRDDFKMALNVFAGRDRRYGGVKSGLDSKNTAIESDCKE